MSKLLQFQQPESAEALALGTGPMPAGPYYRREHFELEREAVFKRTWLNVGHECELPVPGSFIVRELDFAGASILITRDKHHVLRAFYNVCSHRGTQLVADAAGTRATFTCPYHGWTFNNDGGLRAAPDFDRFHLQDKSDCSLPRVSVDVCAGLLFVNLDPQPQQSLREFLGDFAGEWEKMPVARATAFSEYTYELNANWKITYDNFQETYHVRFVHSRSGGGGAVGADNPFGYPSHYRFHKEHRGHEVWSNPSPQLTTTQRLAFGRLMPALDRKSALQVPYGRGYWAVFPNMFMIGTAAQPFVHYVMPISEHKARGVIRIYWVGEDDSASERFGREYALGALRDVHSEDCMLIESMQKGLKSGALKHVHLQSQEVLIRHLMVQINQKIEAYLQEQGTANAEVNR